jgi:hypothetical protein
VAISDFVEWELGTLREGCNFTGDELEFFNLRAKDNTIEEIAELMNISISKANRLSKKVSCKVIKVLPPPPNEHSD